ncbi:MAG: type II secretion system F family protein [Armatimonadetes bacterium]|nr:type II secretion system F family protein [Armatimonadota bacterium]
MSTFSFTARDRSGRQHTGTVQAPDRERARERLSRRFESIVRIEPADSSRPGWWQGPGGSRVGGEDLLGFTQQLAAATDSGLPLKTALDMLSHDVENRMLRNAISEVSAAVGAGEGLSAALAQHPRVFPEFYRSLIKAGEASGELPAILDRLAAHIARTEKIVSEVKGALVYPVVVLVFAFLVCFLFLTFGVPRFEAVYETLGGRLPPPTRAAISIGKVLSLWWPVALLILGAVALMVSRVFSAGPGARMLETFAWNVYPLAPLFRYLAIARFSRTLATLYSSGVPILEALGLVAASGGSQRMRDCVLSARESVREGGTLTGPLRESGLFPSLAIGMITAGEETGTLDRMLEKLATHYEMRVETALRTVMSLLEPLLLIVVGCAIGALILVLALPLLNIGSLF